MSSESRAPGRSRVVARPHGDGLLRWWDPTGAARASVVLCHGYAEHSGRYEAVAARLAERGLAVWAIDLRGHGASGGERASVVDVAHLVEDVEHALDVAREARPALPVFLVGHSMGGLVSTALAIAHQDRLRGLVLSGAAVSDPSGIEPLLEIEPLPEVVLSSELLSRDPKVSEHYDADPLNYRGPFRRETLRALTSGAREVRARFAELRLPLLVLHGGDDQIVPATASEDLFAGASSPDKELGIYPGLRHEILNEPEGPEITERIAAWILARA
ncbi:lysophospholipase [Candidatus Binatia bacterium]|jgi:alpha-beta hydrolase superfamily lysophospholipase|nr:lysophospholipase [Candidatus Binatia bacterium]